MNFMSAVLYSTGFVYIDMTGSSTDDTLVWAQERADYGIVYLCAANHEVYFGFRTIQIFFDFCFGFFTPWVNAISAIAFCIGVHQCLQNLWMCATVIVVVESNHHEILLCLFNCVLIIIVAQRLCCWNKN